MTDPLGQSQVLPYLRGIARAGYEIHLVSFEKSDRFRAHKRKIYEICDDAGINWHPQDYSNEGGLRKTIRQVGKMKRVAKYLNNRHHFDIVHCRSYIAAIAGQMMKKKYGTKFIFDMRGFWADERVDGNLWSLSNPLYKLIYKYFKRKEVQFLNEADYVISLTDNAKKVIRGWNINHQPEIEVIPCCVDLDLFDPDKVNKDKVIERKTELGIASDSFVLGYIGSIGTWYMLPEMLDYFKVFLEKKERSVFLFVSNEPEEKLKHEAGLKGIPAEKIIVRSVMHDEVPDLISVFDASIFFIKPAFSKKASSPTKQGELMAMGVPLICNSGVGDTDGIVLKYHAGEIIDTFNDETYLNNIIDPDKFDRNEIERGAKEYFSLEEGVKRYLRVYKSIDA